MSMFVKVHLEMKRNLQKSTVMGMKRLYVAVLLLLLVTSVSAQLKPLKKNQQLYFETVERNYLDSLSRLVNHYDSTWQYNGSDLLHNPYYFRLFIPTFYYAPIKQRMDNTWVGQYNRLRPAYGSRHNLRDSQLQLDSTINHMLADLYISHPQLITSNEIEFQSSEGLRKDVKKELKHEVVLTNIVQPKKHEDVADPVHVVFHRPNFWKFSHSYSLSLHQNYFSENWYQGGDNYYSFSGQVVFKLNYNNQRNITLNNTLDTRLGFQTAKGDTIHPFHTNSDQIRMTNQLGLKAYKDKWQYTMTNVCYTQLFPMYASNSYVVQSDIFSPFNLNLSIGLQYSYSTKNGKFNFSINMAPLSFDYRYVARESLETRHGLKAGSHYSESYGSNVTINYSWQMLKELRWQSRMYYFTPFDRVQMEWENTFSFTINKYLSTNLYLYPRFDDTRKNANGHYRLQFKQNIALSFSLSL